LPPARPPWKLPNASETSCSHDGPAYREQQPLRPGRLAGVSRTEDASRTTSKTRSSPATGGATRGGRVGGARGTERDREADRVGTTFDLRERARWPTARARHSHRRIVHALGDSTCFEGLMRAIIATAKTAPGRDDLDDKFHRRYLLTHGRRASGRSCRGRGWARCWCGRQRDARSGGCGMDLPRDDNAVATGDAWPAAYRGPGPSCATWSSLQFTRPVLYVAGSDRYLVSERSARGGYLS